MPKDFKKVTIYLLVLLILLIGCDRQAADPPATGQKAEDVVITDVTSYFPTKNNLTWGYEGEGNEYASFRKVVLYQEEDLVQMTENNGGTVLGQVFRISPEEVVKIYSQEEFYEEKNILAVEPSRQEVILKSPLKAGAQWQDDQYQREVISIDETIKVPAGKYEQVVKIKITSLEAQVAKESENYEYYAKDTGLVMREFISGDIRVTSKLKSFEQNQPLK